MNELEAAEVLWDFHQMHQSPRPTDVAIGLGSHDIGVAEHTAALYHQGMFPLIVFTGANAPTTVEVFPRGEAIHYAERAQELGVPSGAILTETQATNTAENFTLTRTLLADSGIEAESATIVSRPYQQRRAYATCRKLWPELDIVCTSTPQSLRDYMETIGDGAKVLNMLVGDTQRIWVYAESGDAIPQTVPPTVRDAYEDLVSQGYTQRLVRQSAA